MSIRTKTAAVIEISSNNVRMVIGQKEKDNVKILDFLEYPLSIGRDTFTNGKVSYEKVYKACEIIKNYLTVAEAYGVDLENIKLIATSALREAGNRSYILDQIRLKTGIEVDILDNQEEKLLVFKRAFTILGNSYPDSSLLLFIGSGNVGFSIIENGRIPLYQSIKIGPLRINELFEDVASHSLEYHVIIDEYIKTFINGSKKYFPEKIDYLIVTGGDISLIGELCKARKTGSIYEIDRTNFNSLFSEVKNKTAETISSEYNIPFYKSKLLMPAMCICNVFLESTAGNVIAAPKAYLNEAVLYRILFPKVSTKVDKDMYKNTLLSAKTLGAKFNVNELHSEAVSNFAVKIFDKIKKIHGMGTWERVLLQVAAFLHECGKFINSKEHALNAYNIIKSLDIIGLNQSEVNIVALIAFMHSATSYSDFDTPLNETSVVTASKLAAILRIADALDRSQMQKINDINVNLTNDLLVINVEFRGNIELEKWSFDYKSAFFEEVFGIKPVLHMKLIV